MTGVPGPDPRAKGLKHLGEINNVLSSSEREGYNLSRCLVILKLYIDFYQNEKQLCHTDLSSSSIGKQTAKLPERYPC